MQTRLSSVSCKQPVLLGRKAVSGEVSLPVQLRRVDVTLETSEQATDDGDVRASACEMSTTTSLSMETTPSSFLSKLMTRRIRELQQPRSATWASKVEELAGRGVTVAAILNFYVEVFDLMPHFDPAKSTTRDVVRAAIIPRTRGDPETGVPGSSLATVLNSGFERTPTRMITHHWGNVWSHTIAAVLADAFGSPTYEHLLQELTSVAGALSLRDQLVDWNLDEVTYWFCPFSVNQHASICSGLAHPGAATECDTITLQPYPLCGCGLRKHFEGDLCEVNKFMEMMSFLSRRDPELGHVIVVDQNFDVFERAWCVAELAQGKRDGLKQSLKIPSMEVVQQHRCKLERLDVRKCESSRPEDKVCILESISDVQKLNTELRRLLLQPKEGLLEAWSESVLDFQRFIIEWSGFSREFHRRLSVESMPGRAPFWLLPGLILVPWCFAFAELFVPHANPEEGLWANYLHVFVSYPMLTFAAFAALSQWISLVFKRRLPRRCTLFWPLLGTVITTGVLIFVATAGGVYPVPFSPHLIGLMMLWPCAPMLWFMLPQDIRRAEDSRALFCWALAASVVLSSVALICYPLVCVLIGGSPEAGRQTAAVIIFGLIRFLLDRCSECFSRRLGPDVMPAMVFGLATTHQLAVCTFFSSMDPAYGFIALVAVDVAETCYYLYCFCRDQPGVRKNPLDEGTPTPPQLLATLQAQHALKQDATQQQQQQQQQQQEEEEQQQNDLELGVPPPDSETQAAASSGLELSSSAAPTPAPAPTSTPTQTPTLTLAAGVDVPPTSAPPPPPPPPPRPSSGAAAAAAAAAAPSNVSAVTLPSSALALSGCIGESFASSPMRRHYPRASAMLSTISDSPRRPRSLSPRVSVSSNGMIAGQSRSRSFGASGDSRVSTLPFCETVTAAMLLRQFAALVVPAQLALLIICLNFAPEISSALSFLSFSSTTTTTTSAAAAAAAASSSSSNASFSSSSSALSHNAWAAVPTGEDGGMVLALLIADACVGVLASFVIHTFLKARGVKPLGFLKGLVVSSNSTLFLWLQCACWLWFVATQLVHNACDYSLQFDWI